MILKVKNEKQVTLGDMSDGFQRESMNKSAMSSFEVQLARAVKKASSEGQAPEHIAAGYGLPVETIRTLIAMELPEEKSRLERTQDIEKDSCEDGCAIGDSEEDKEKSFKDKYLSDAEAAYNELHGQKKAASLPQLSDVVRSSIQKSRKGDVEEVGGSQKQLRYKNSIWDSEVLARQASVKDNGERIREEKEALAAQRQFRKDSEQRVSWEDLKASIEAGDMKKEASIHALGGSVEAHNYNGKLQRRGLSIFSDTTKENPFDHIVEKTEGEKVAEAASKPKEKDRSWVKNASSKMGNAQFSKMIESMLDQKE